MDHFFGYASELALEVNHSSALCRVMPTVRAADLEEQEEEVFKSPEWEPDTPGQDQGASPQLRRSARKRKSTAGEEGPSKNSSKKKKSSPDHMPKTARSPPKAQGNAQAKTPQDTQSFEALLIAMENRLSAKLEKASQAALRAADRAELNCEGIVQLESRVDANEECLMAALKESETRIMAKVQAQMNDMVNTQVAGMVSAQLTAAGFDQNLSASDLTLRRSAIHCGTGSEGPSTSYAEAAAAPVSLPTREPEPRLSKEDKREVNFQVARRSLRLWPIEGGSREGLEHYMKSKLRLDQAFIDEELGQVVLKRPREPKGKNKDEFIVIFESKQIRDAIKAAAPNLANHRETAGMRLHVPDHLQREFQSLMNLSYDLKKKHPALKRNVKFDEEDGGLFLDLKLDDESEWKRIKPATAMAANKRRKGAGVKSMGEEELGELLGGDDE